MNTDKQTDKQTTDKQVHPKNNLLCGGNYKFHKQGSVSSIILCRWLRYQNSQQEFYSYSLTEQCHFNEHGYSHLLTNVYDLKPNFLFCF